VIPERIVRVRSRTVLGVIGIVLAVLLLVEIVLISKQVLSWILVAVFLTLALNPLVEWFLRRGVKKRGYSVGIVYVIVLALVGLIAYVFIPPLVDQVNNFVDKIPDYIDDITKGRGSLGFLETKYHIVERVKKALSEGGAARLFGFTGTALSITKSVVTIVIAAVTITFMTFFMLLEGPSWVERFYSALPNRSQSRWRTVGRDIYRTVGGYVLGNIVISIIAGGSATIVLYILGVPLPFALGLLVGLFDLIPLAGATIAVLIVGTISFLHTITAGIVVVGFLLVYQQLENHILQPVIYGKTVKLSPLTVFIAVLIGAALAGILGALAAIPIAGAIQVIIRDLIRERAHRKHADRTAIATFTPEATL
jgi:predicted PurR-regulated permease PerM